MPSCEICSGESFRPIWVAQRYIGDAEPPAICQNCGFVQVNERRSSAEIAEDWKRIYKEKIYDPTWPGVKARLYYVAEWIDQNIGLEDKRVLDIGGGTGSFRHLVEARQSSSDDMGVYFFDPAFDGRLVEDFEPPLPFDIVTILWTLENCGSANAMIAKARECLKPDGHLVVATGSRILVPFRKPMSQYFSTEPQDLHAFRWSYQSLCAIMEKHGFAVQRPNDYLQNDVLLVHGHLSNADWSKDEIIGDNPDAVENHFIDWYRSFP